MPYYAARMERSSASYPMDRSLEGRETLDWEGRVTGVLAVWEARERSFCMSLEMTSILIK